MRKNILTTVIALAFTSLTAFAQTEKEYSMIVTLQNGTTITLGHNDIKNITFTGDSIAATGNIVSSMEKLQKDLVNTADSITSNTVLPLAIDVADNSIKIQQHEDSLAEVSSKIKEIEAKQEQDEANVLQIYFELRDEMKNEVRNLEDKQEAADTDLKMKIANLEALVATLQKQIDELKESK